MPNNQKTNFCKVFVIEDGNQILYKTTLNDKCEKELCVSTVIRGFEISVSLSNFIGEEKTLYEELNKITQEYAQEMYNSFKSLTQ